MNGLSVLVVGATDDAARSECGAAISALSTLATVEYVADLRAAESCLAGGSMFDLIAIAESRPGQCSTAQIDALRTAAPLARVWRLLGSWCEGEQRSGQPPTGCSSAYWHQSLSRLSREMVAASAGQCPAWSLPLTVTPGERTLAAAELPIEQHSGTVAIRAARAEAAAALADACRLGGYEAMVVAEDDSMRAANPRAIVWDTSAEHVVDPKHVNRIRRGAAGAPLLAIVGFPRPQDTQCARQAGVDAVISKPYLVHDLLWHLSRHAKSPS